MMCILVISFLLCFCLIVTDSTTGFQHQTSSILWSSSNSDDNNDKCLSVSFNDDEIDKAINAANNENDKLMTLESDLFVNKQLIDTTKISTAARHQMSSNNGEQIKKLQDNQRVYEEASRFLLKNLSLTKDDFQALRYIIVDNPVHSRKKRQTCQADLPIRCVRSKYRTADGSCNNMQQTRWGKSFECVARILDPEYADGVSIPRVSKSGEPLPNTRILSSALHFEQDISASYTHMMMQFGQFVDHDISLSPVSQLSKGALDCCARASHPDCFPIEIPRDDAFYSRFGQTCINVVRSAQCETCKLGPRLQLNQLTSFIDASNVYGSTVNETAMLRAFDGLGRLAFGADNKGRSILPSSLNMRNDQCSRPEQNQVCFRAGDNTRVNQHPALTSMHTIWMRQHNRLAIAMKNLNPHWDDETLFQETRRIVGAQMQVITYKEFLPVLLGKTVLNFYNLNVLSRGYTKYESDMNPSILSEFSSAAFRFGHSILNGIFTLMRNTGQSNSYNLRDNFFFPFSLRAGEIDNIMRGMLAKSAQRCDPFIHDDIRNHLYKPSGSAFGSDLPAINIQRGRDHGIPGYTKYLKFCFNDVITKFAELDQYMPSAQRIKFQQIYQDVDDIDLFSGGISEFPLKDGIIGPTFACIIGLQFNRLKYGDRYWFEHGDQDGSFTPGQLQSLRETTFAKVICENGDDFPVIHSRVFLQNSESDPNLRVKPCGNIADIELLMWRD